MNLEQEYQKLMDEVVKSIADKRAKGTLSQEEAADLVDMVSDRRHPPRRAWNSSGCSFDDDTDYDEAWNRSGQAC